MISKEVSQHIVEIQAKILEINFFFEKVFSRYFWKSHEIIKTFLEAKYKWKLQGVSKIHQWYLTPTLTPSIEFFVWFLILVFYTKVLHFLVHLKTSLFSRKINSTSEKIRQIAITMCKFRILWFFHVSKASYFHETFSDDFTTATTVLRVETSLGSSRSRPAVQAILT